jgi:hypothetical protein
MTPGCSASSELLVHLQSSLWKFWKLSWCWRARSAPPYVYICAQCQLPTAVPSYVPISCASPSAFKADQRQLCKLAKRCAKHASTLLLETLLATLQQNSKQRRPTAACKAAHACNAVKPTMLCAPSNPCRQLALNDAIMRHLSGPTLVQPTVIVALALGSLYASFICFAQSVRLYVHTVRAARKYYCSVRCSCAVQCEQLHMQQEHTSSGTRHEARLANITQPMKACTGC